jgi:hypothetical protein
MVVLNKVGRYSIGGEFLGLVAFKDKTSLVAKNPRFYKHDFWYSSECKFQAILVVVLFWAEISAYHLGDALSGLAVQFYRKMMPGDKTVRGL